VAAANEAFSTWRHTSVEERAKFLNAIADEIEKRKDLLASLEVQDMGKPLAEAELDLGGSSSVLLILLLLVLFLLVFLLLLLLLLLL
jgi:succinate-semialdehyde dehydrogenase/glutarate-semialdehyde dehydrogenase